MMKIEHKTLPLGAIAANCTILWGDERRAWIVDPGGEPETIADFLREKGLEPVCVALTHAHFDHIGAIPGLLARFPGLPVHAGPGDAVMFGDPRNAWEPEYACVPPPATLTTDLADGATLTAGGLAARVVATPGHTPGGVCLHFADSNLLLTGDTLFAGSIGRTDLPGGDYATLCASLGKLRGLPPETQVVCGHGSTTTLAREFATNPFLKQGSR